MYEKPGRLWSPGLGQTRVISMSNATKNTTPLDLTGLTSDELLTLESQFRNRPKPTTLNAMAIPINRDTQVIIRQPTHQATVEIVIRRRSGNDVVSSFALVTP